MTSCHDESRTVNWNVSFLPLRNTGIRVVPMVQWGTHLCVLYDSKQDLLDVGVSWFEAGLVANEFCAWVISDPITEEDALQALNEGIVDFKNYHRSGQFQILDFSRWYMDGDQLGLEKAFARLSTSTRGALAKGYSGLRASGNTFWSGSSQWQVFQKYELEVHQSMTGQNMLVLCTYPLQTSRASEVLDLAEAHNSVIVRRNQDWEFLVSPDLKSAKREIQRLSGALNILTKPFPGHDLLTPRERMALAQIVRGASSKEAARTLGVSPRTMEFHRANILKKLGARNTADLLRRVLVG
jgi:DNA-binding CsgD family transcriptional regulator